MKTKTINIADRLIGENEPCFIIAEAGVNHNGDINLAKRLIEVARESGADAVKFQAFRAEDLAIRSAEKAEYQKESSGAGESQFAMLQKLELAEKDFAALLAYARAQGIIFLASSFDTASVDLLSRLGVPAFKVPSGELTNFALLRHIARQPKPVILSTGMATLEEVAEALLVLKEAGARDIILLHCVTSYPARIEDMNLKVMATLRKTFRQPVGLSDHSPGITIPVAAVALGACVLEKHFTLDRDLPGPDHKASLAPEELRQMVAVVRDLEKAMGNGLKRLTAEEEEIKKIARRTIVARVAIRRGDIITGPMLAVKRAGGGLEPKDIGAIIGKRARKDIMPEEIITLAEVM